MKQRGQNYAHVDTFVIFALEICFRYDIISIVNGAFKIGGIYEIKKQRADD